MHDDKYFFTRTPKEYYYDFVSIGPKGEVPKRVCLSWIGGTGDRIYSLSFGDLDKVSGAIDDRAKTNNSDRRKVLATVAAAIMDFLHAWPRVRVMAVGNTPVRNRLYQIALVSVLDQIGDQFILLGSCCGEWELFRKGINYDAFMVMRRHTPPAFVVRMPRNTVPPRMSMLQ